MINIDSMIKKTQQEGFKEEDATAKVSETEMQETYRKLPANHKTIFLLLFATICYPGTYILDIIHFFHPFWMPNSQKIHFLSIKHYLSI